MNRATSTVVVQVTANCPPHSSRPGRRIRRRGLTLVEMMVSVTITLLVVFAIVQVFDMMGNTVAMGRATMEMAGQLRSVSQLLQQDLDNLTCPVRPWIDPDSGLGYFEYVEGPNGVNRSSDANADADLTLDAVDANADGIPDEPTHFGDRDDKLFFTVRSMGEPFTGRFTYYTNGGVTEPAPYRTDGSLKPNLTPQKIIIKSNLAEVAWWVTDGVLYRRVLLVLPSLNGSMPPVASDSLPVGLVSENISYTDFTPAYLQSFYRDCDVSVRVVTDNMGRAIGLAANTMSDLTTPRNRFAHYAADTKLNTTSEIQVDSPFGNPAAGAYSFPNDFIYPLDVRHFDPSLNSNSKSFILGDDRLGEDVAIADILAFDVRAYDPAAPVCSVNGVPLSPSDPGYPATAVAVLANIIGNGAFVDLGFSPGNPDPAAESFDIGRINDPVKDIGGAPQLVTYDTWTLHYERDGIDQNDDGTVDEGFNGLDDPVPYTNPPQGRNGIDDIDERETRPPYDLPLRGIEVRIRQIEFSTGQVRQVSVVGDFTD